MNLESQVTSLELSKKLKELGIKQESFFHWYVGQRSKYAFILESKTCNYVVDSQDTYDIYSAFTASELLELLPETIHYNHRLHIIKSGSIGNNMNLCVFYKDLMEHIYDNNICNALAKMLIHLIENKLIDNNNKIEQPYTNDLCCAGRIKDWIL